MEAATLAFAPLGWRCAFLSEIEKAPCALLEQRYPDVPNFGDMTKFEEWPDVAIDLLAGGTPCQAFSVAGLRRGLSDPRGSLMLVYGAIAKRYRPTWLFWENVPGVLSSDGGRDFGSFLGMLAELGYGFAYRVLDAQFFGLAQRRARVFVVGYLGDWRPPAAVLFERESLRGDSPPSRQAGEGIAPTIAARTRGGGGLGTDAECDGALIPELARSLCAHPARIDGESETFVVANTLLGKENSSHAADMDTYVAHALTGEGFDASEDGTGRGTPLVPIAYQTSGNCGAWETGDMTGALDTMTDPNSHVICFSGKDHGADAGELAPTLRAMGHDGSHANAGGQLAIAFDTTQITSATNRSNPQAGDPCHPITAEGHPPAIVEQWAVRRLTPLECERLQGAPDEHTNIAYRGRNTIADGPRYKMIGNSWAVPVVNWIGGRIAAVHTQRSAQTDGVTE